jgi:hypothetical protein
VLPQHWLALRQCAALGDGVSGPFRAALKTYRKFAHDFRRPDRFSQPVTGRRLSRSGNVSWSTQNSFPHGSRNTQKS